jgi:hypothetical protein
MCAGIKVGTCGVSSHIYNAVRTRTRNQPCCTIGKELPPLPTGTEWTAGDVVEVAWTHKAFHGGGTWCCQSRVLYFCLRVAHVYHLVCVYVCVCVCMFVRLIIGNSRMICYGNRLSISALRSAQITG